MQVKEFTLVNEEKVERALHGTLTANGAFTGGIVKADGSYEDDALLAEYDKFGGLILKGADTVKTGSFYDFRNRKPKATPEVIYVYRINGKIVEVPEGAELPGIVKAAQILNNEAALEAEKTSEEKAEKKVIRRKK